MAGTVQMGTSRSNACVDSRFRVFGVDGLRVADMSVVPFVPKCVQIAAPSTTVLTMFSCHVQSTACILGEIAADTIIEEYELSNPCKLARMRL